MHSRDFQLPPIDDTVALTDALRPAVLKLGRLLRREAQKVGVSSIDALLLAHIKKHPGIGVSELAGLEQMSNPSMSAHIKRLEAAGLVTRDQAAPGDQRRARLLLTDKARQSLATIRARRNDWLATQLDRLDNAELTALRAAIPAIVRLTEGEV